MSAAFYIVLEKRSPSIDSSIDGKALSRASDDLDPIARNLGVRPLIGFFSADPDQMTEFVDSGDIQPSPTASLVENWFEARDGLETVSGLREHLQKHPRAVRDVEDVLADLLQFERVLKEAQNVHTRWHLAVDF